MIERILATKMISMAQKFQVITLTGPRQSGKTTLVKSAFPALPYASLEEPDIRQIALTDPRGFLSNYPNGAILDEIQNTPELFSYIQSLVDENRQVQFILTGSSNFLLMEKISQTLAGRTAVLHLLPFSYNELELVAESYESLVFKGQYPRIYDRGISPTDFYPSYIQTYVERDVRLMKNIGDINTFIQFTRLCAGRIGQLLNHASLASDAGISPNTARSWLSILESSYILYRLQPYHRNFNVITTAARIFSRIFGRTTTAKKLTACWSMVKKSRQLKLNREKRCLPVTLTISNIGDHWHLCRKIKDMWSMAVNNRCIQVAEN